MNICILVCIDMLGIWFHEVPVDMSGWEVYIIYICIRKFRVEIWDNSS